MATEQGLSTYYSLLGLAGIKGRVVKTMFEKNPPLKDAPVFPANEKMGHTGTRATSLPAPTVRKVSGYVTPTTAQMSPYSEDISIFDGACAVPADVIKLEGASKMVTMEALHREGFGQGVMNWWFYGDNSTKPEYFRSFGQRYKTPDNNDSTYSPENPDTSTAADVNVYDAEGTGSDTCSIWFFRWGAEQVHVITPTGDTGHGIVETDNGREKQWSSDTWRYVYTKEWEWWHGLAVPNQKCVARIRNIESSIDSISASLKKLIFRCVNEGLTEGNGTIWMYIPRRLKTHFDVLLEAKQNVTFSRDNPYNVEMPMWGGTIPIQTCDALTITETAVAAV